MPFTARQGIAQQWPERGRLRRDRPAAGSAFCATASQVVRLLSPLSNPCVKGALPPAANGSPFGPRLHALVLYLKTFQAVTFARLAGMLYEVFGVKVSQGALANMLKRSHEPFEIAKQDIIGDLRQAETVASDETGIRIEGLNGYQWVFMCDQAVVHEAQLSRAAQVVRDALLSDAVHRPPGEGWEITVRRSGCQMGIRPNKNTGCITKPAWHTWSAMSLMA